jgi:quercetin dioxygenase-like cupin family protein
VEITRNDTAEVVRREFLKIAGVTALGLTATVLSGAKEGTPKRQERHMEMKRNGSQPSSKGPAEYFTGSVRIDPLSPAHDPSRSVVGSVTFEPGARTAWHTHPLGQILVVTAGCGRCQRWGGPVEEIKPGDVVWIPPGEKHWHGAAPTTAMTHIAIQEQQDGKTADWLEKVTDEQYGK